MNCELIVVGKSTEQYLITGVEQYIKRLSHYTRFKIDVIPELKNAKNLSIEQIKTTEGELILSKLSTADHVVLLDEGGKLRSSEQTAQWLQGVFNRGGKGLVFIIGGAYGFSESVYKRADEKMSLSPMTFSHQMVRLIFVEQLYRAHTILAGQPYHHN